MLPEGGGTEGQNPKGVGEYRAYREKKYALSIYPRRLYTFYAETSEAHVAQRLGKQQKEAYGRRIYRNGKNKDGEQREYIQHDKPVKRRKKRAVRILFLCENIYPVSAGGECGAHDRDCGTGVCEIAFRQKISPLYIMHIVPHLCYVIKAAYCIIFSYGV